MNASIAKMKIDSLRHAGFLVVAWTPDELKFCDEGDINLIEERCTELGNNMIADASREIPASIKAGILTTECGDTLDLAALQEALVTAFQVDGDNKLSEFAEQLSEITGVEIKP